jgi:hypothetical protein
VESVVFDFEDREVSGAILVSSLARVAEALGCKLVYGIVPQRGQTYEEVAEEREWEQILERKKRGRAAGPSALNADDSEEKQVRKSLKN